jgi:putative transposase
LNNIKFNPEKHHRRSIRLKDYDYSEAGGYFPTICSFKRNCIFGEVINGEMHLNKIGRVVKEQWMKSVYIRKEIISDEFIIMPKHVHDIAMITESDVGATDRSLLRQTNGPEPRSIGSLIARFKSSATKRINKMLGTPGLHVWQRNYYEHIIRDEKDLQKIREYIVHNPLKWNPDIENPKNISRS